LVSGVFSTELRFTSYLSCGVHEVSGNAARQAKLRGVSLSKTVSDLLRKGLNASTPAQDKDGLVVFHLPSDSPQVTTDDVRRIKAEMGHQ
jgi:CTP:molybdopterin cytidylyltransferase MocA